ncbi:MAG: hypothetical protein IPO91_26765 [Chloroflexi bacterium]|nr:hypothetical protein [Chloroflexota bacterium]
MVREKRRRRASVGYTQNWRCPRWVQRLRDPGPVCPARGGDCRCSIQDRANLGYNPFIKLLEDPDPQVRWAAVESFGTLRDPSVS